MTTPILTTTRGALRATITSSASGVYTVTAYAVTTNGSARPIITRRYPRSKYSDAVTAARHFITTGYLPGCPISTRITH